MRVFLKLFCAILFGVCSSHVTAADAETRQADVVVYGDASGGVTAAVQAARMGKKVILVSQYGPLSTDPAEWVALSAIATGAHQEEVSHATHLTPPATPAQGLMRGTVSTQEMNINDTLKHP